MKGRNKWFRQGTVATAILAGGLGILGVNRQASADRAALPDDLENQYAEQVVAAETKANGGQFADALRIGEGIPTNSRHYSTILQKQEMWAKLLLQQARDASQRGELQKATALVRPLVSRPNLAPEAQRLSAQWQQQAELMAQVEQAQVQEDWQGVRQSIETIRATDTTLANTPKLQAISQEATLKAYASPEGTTTAAFTEKPIATPAAFTDVIGRNLAPSPVMLQIGDTAIDISTVTKATQPEKPTAVVTPQPIPRRVVRTTGNEVLSATVSKSSKEVALVDSGASISEVTGGDNAPTLTEIESIGTSPSMPTAMETSTFESAPAYTTLPDSPSLNLPMETSTAVETVGATVPVEGVNIPLEIIQKDAQGKISNSFVH
ncbi:hypothetical protein [Leptolyngbya ohadii]|uniref:hypothetical protein n=1 Tax=Leptolyngbya ohadii TaxID=1962290 RepID=UPI000B5A0EA2|nr:hypothetical protein [Leptolyngbya ohadii]